MLAVALPELNLPCAHCHKNPKLQIENGCLRDSPIPDRWQIGEFTFQRCPRKLVTRKSISYIKAYNWLQKGFLPSPGGWMEQSAKFINAMEIIEAEVYRIQKDELESLEHQKY